MVIVAVDPNKKDLKQLVKFLRLAFPGCEIIMFSDPEDAAMYIKDNPIDALYSEVAMLGLNGFELQAATEAVQPATLTVMVTATDSYVNEAIKTRAQDYIIKPVTKQNIIESMNNTRYARQSKT